MTRPDEIAALAACETPLSDHVASFWKLLETETVHLSVNIRRVIGHDAPAGATVYYDCSTFSDEVAKELVRLSATSPGGAVREVTDNDIYYLKSVQRQLAEFGEALEDTAHFTLSGIAFADTKDWLDCFIDKHERALAPAEKAGDASISPPPRWKENDGSDRHPQTLAEWDWRADAAPHGFDRSLRRLNVASDYEDSRAPDQMALVLRIDLLRLIGGWTHKNAYFQMMKELRESATPTPPSADVAKRYQHRKRGSTYIEIGRGKVQSEHWRDPNVDGDYDTQSVDMREVVVYRADSDGSIWVRPVEEFDDGRFDLIQSAAPGGGTEGGEA